MESNNDSDDASGGEVGDVNFADSPWDCDGCPPPFFELPPPPRPPFMDGDFCEGSSSSGREWTSWSHDSSHELANIPFLESLYGSSNF